MSLKEELFGPSKEEIWQQLAKEINGKFIQGSYAKPTKVEVKFKNWTITLDTTFGSSIGNQTFAPENMKLRAPFLNKDNFQMTISSNDTSSLLEYIFGSSNIDIGFPEFDKAFTIKGSDKKKINLLLTNEKIRELLLKSGEVHFEIRDQEGMFGTQLPDKVNELYLKTEDVILDIEKLKVLFELFSEILDQLCHLDLAYEDDPNVILD